MSGGLLSADMRTLSASIRGGIDWWWRELVEMLPTSARRLLDRRPALLATLTDGGIAFSRDGRAVSPRKPGEVTLLLPADQVLVRVVPAPPLADRDVRRMLLLDVDRLTPFTADAVFSDVEVASGSTARRRAAALAVVPRAFAIGTLERAAALDLRPRALSIAGPDGRPQFDFLPAVHAATGGKRGISPRALWWSIVALLLLTNLAVAIMRDRADIDRLQERVDAQQPSVDRVNVLRRQVQLTEATRARLVARRNAYEPLRVLALVTRALPDGAWVQRFTLNGRSVRLVGYRQDQVDVVAALRRQPQFSNVRETVESGARLPAGQPFDVSADLTGAAL